MHTPRMGLVFGEKNVGHFAFFTAPIKAGVASLQQSKKSRSRYVDSTRFFQLYVSPNVRSKHTLIENFYNAATDLCNYIP
jgi:hypothetical protein